MDVHIWVGMPSDFLGSMALCKEVLGGNMDIPGISMALDDYDR